MKKRDSVFGLCNVIKNYGWNGFFKDSIIPMIISIVLCIIIYLTENDITIQIKFLLNLGISVVPSMTAFILAAYTIMLSFIFGKAKDKLKQTEEGRKLIKSINGGFAACLLLSILTIIVLVFVSILVNLNIKIDCPNVVNYPIFFFVCYLLVYSVYVIFGVVIDLFNSGQTILLEK